MPTNRMNRENYIRSYKDWLIAKMDGQEYSEMFDILLGIEFCPQIGNDTNRAEDGIQLRELYLKETGGSYRKLPVGPCSILEMLIALAIRCEDDIMKNDEYGDRTTKWFWIMIDNLRMSTYTDDTITPIVRNAIYSKAYKINSRTYDRNGFGGLWPLRDPKEDQRKVEIWYQMNAYLMENFAF